LRLQMTKRGECFTAELAPGKVLLSRHKVLNPEKFELGEPRWKKPQEADVPELNQTRPIAVEFINVDYRVSVRINGREVVSTNDDLYTPNPDALFAEFGQGRSADSRPIVRIVAANQTSTIEHLRLAKDGYYINEGSHYDADGKTSSNEAWFATPKNIMELGPDEYFVLGDNSQVSLDARFWGAPVDLPAEGDYHVGPGRVPGRFLLGKAFFVYWPAGYRPPNLGFGIRPDFGDMRFIR
jgi:hypothetical protein